MTLRVATWNLFHGQTSPPDGRDHFEDFAGALDAASWDVCALQEVPPWWAADLGERCGASVRVVRSSLMRALLPALQFGVDRRRPGLLGTAGAAVNVLLVRPSAGRITAHRRERVRRLPQRRTVHAVRIEPVSATVLWVANVHCHNRPVQAAADDTARALAIASAWAGGEPVVLAGDLNVDAALAERIAGAAGFGVLAGYRVDHVLGCGVEPRGESSATRVPAPDAGDNIIRTLADHRLVTVKITT